MMSSIYCTPTSNIIMMFDLNILINFNMAFRYRNIYIYNFTYFRSDTILQKKNYMGYRHAQFFQRVYTICSQEQVIPGLQYEYGNKA